MHVLLIIRAWMCKKANKRPVGEFIQTLATFKLRVFCKNSDILPSKHRRKNQNLFCAYKSIRIYSVLHQYDSTVIEHFSNFRCFSFFLENFCTNIVSPRRVDINTINIWTDWRKPFQTFLAWCDCLSFCHNSKRTWKYNF